MVVVVSPAPVVVTLSVSVDVVVYWNPILMNELSDVVVVVETAASTDSVVLKLSVEVVVIASDSVVLKRSMKVVVSGSDPVVLK